VLAMISAFPRVLAIDDDPDARALLEYGLGNLGFDVKTVPDGYGAVHAIKQWAPEVILLDVGLPGIDGFSLIANLRRLTDIPILMLTGRTATPDKVSALTRGADDYIAKPFDMDELAARIQARLRRPHLETRDVVRYADLTVDVTHRTAARAGKPIELSAREFDLLLTLVRHPQQVFTRSQLLDLVWGIDRGVTPATVETYISYLRSKVDIEGAPRLIHTLRGVGYTMRLDPIS
jgi:DNA-binding response OmpR family regulator